MAASASSDRIGEIEQRLARLEVKVDAIGPEVRAEIRTSEEETRRLFSEGDEETRRLLRESEEETRRQVREGDEETRRLLRNSEEETRRLIRDGDEETRRHMRLLHEEVIGRIAMLGESLSSEGPPRRRRRPKA